MNYYDYENSNNNSYDNKNYENKKISSISINLGDLMVLEEKFKCIIYSLKNKKEANYQCFDFWNYFYNCSLYQRMEKTFVKRRDIDIVQLSINYLLFTVMLCYEFSFEINVLNKAYILLLEILDLNHKNLIFISENILNKIPFENKNNIWVMKLLKIFENSKNQKKNNYYNIENLKTIAEKINDNTDLIIKRIKNILFHYKTKYSDLLVSLLKKISEKNYEEMDDFYREYILRVENFETSLVASVFLKDNPNFLTVQPPYIKYSNPKNFTLILALNGTLVHFRQTESTQGYLKLRPFLFDFLDEISKYYELIIFTSATKFYADCLIDTIESQKKYFDYKFYREHNIIMGNDFVKDLTRIGRPLDSTIIIDNIPQNFRLQKENGINIKSFWAQDPEDNTLLELLPILVDIAENGYDVRISLTEYKDEILKRVSSNLYMKDI